METNIKDKNNNEDIYLEFAGDEDLINPIKSVNDLIRAVCEINKPYFEHIEPVGNLVIGSVHFDNYEFYAYQKHNINILLERDKERIVFFKTAHWSEEQLQRFIDLYLLEDDRELNIKVKFLEERGIELLYKNYDADTIRRVCKGLTSHKYISIDSNGRVWDIQKNIRCDYQSIEDVFEHAGVMYFPPHLKRPSRKKLRAA